MSLPGSPVSPGPRWAPTHVQVTVLQARDLRSKAKGGGGGGGSQGGSDAYAVMALGKEKFATSVAERCLGAPVWREEATFELPPPPRRGLGALQEAPPPPSPPAALLQLTVFHRALLGLDKFLGRAEVNLAELQAEGGRRSKRWYKLHSKPGKKEKERGEIEVDIQFMRSNMTASMFDLSMKDKSRTPFGKLKDKLKGKRGNGLPDTASAIIPGISHSPADSEEESNEKEKKKSKFKTLFSKPGLHKNSLSQSMSVLPPLKPVSERVRLRPSDYQPEWGADYDDDEDTLTPVSEKPSTNRTEANLLYPPSDMVHKRTSSGDSKQLNQMAGSNTKKDSHSLFGGLKSKNDPASRSNVCINGSHVYMESKSDTLPKDSTPSSPSSQTFQRKRLFLSQENLSFEPSKEPESTGRLPPDNVPPGSSSLESFKAMTLPSYKLLSGEDLLESHTHTPSVISDIPKEIKENKKHDNKKSGLLSLVTGKKEAKISEEGEDSSDTSLKVKEVKRNEKELPKKETNPFEVPVDRKKGHGPEKSSGADVPNTKASLNPFNESMDEEQLEKKSFAVKPSQTNPVKPRLGVSSEDETKATLTFPVSPPVSSFCPFYHSNNENNPFTSKEKAELKSQDSDKFVSGLTNLSAQHYNNPFTTTWEEQSKEQDSDSPAVASLHHISPVSGKENNPFSPQWGQESQIEDSEDSVRFPFYFQHPSTTHVLDSQPFPSPLSNVNNPLISEQGKDSESLNSAPPSFTSTSLVPKLSDSKLLHAVPSERPQNESVTNLTDAISSSPGSVSNTACLYDQVEMIPKTQADEKVRIVPALKENSGRKKKSVKFDLSEPKENFVMSSGDEMSDEDQVERWSDDENEDVLKSSERDRRQRLEPNVELDVEPGSAFLSHDERINSAYNSGNASESDTKCSSLFNIEPPVPVPRVLVPKETNMSRTESSSSSPSAPPKPAPRSALKQKDIFHPQISVSEPGDVPVFKELSSDNSVSSEKLASASSLTISDSTVFSFTRDDSSMNPYESINQPNHVTNTQACILVPGEPNLKASALPVIPEVGSDDEQLSNYHQNTEKMVACGDSPRSGNDFRERELASDAKATGEMQTISFLVKASGSDDALKPNESLLSPSAVILQNARGLEQCGNIVKENRQHDCPEFSNKSVPLSNSSQSYSVSSFQSDGLGCNDTESLKTATTEGLDTKVEISGQKKLPQAWVSPSETHPNQTPQSGQTYRPKLRLHPVKPMNGTTSKPPAKASNIATKIMDNQNDANLKKYDPSDPAYAYAQLTHDELIQLVLKQKDVIAKRDLQVRELEDYIDNLLVRVMEETPNILRVQAYTNKKAGKM